MSIFYFLDENGAYCSESGNRRFNRMNGKDAYFFMKSHPAKKRYFIRTVTDDKGGEYVYIEIPEEYIKICRKDMRRKQYIADCQRLSGITEVSLSTPIENGENHVIEDMVTYSDDVSVENAALHEIELELLRRALKTLTDDELKIIHTLYLADDPISERRLCMELGIPQKTLNNQKLAILKKLKIIYNFFWLIPEKSVQ